MSLHFFKGEGFQYYASASIAWQWMAATQAAVAASS